MLPGMDTAQPSPVGELHQSTYFCSPHQVMELHQTARGESHGQQTTQPSVFNPPKPPMKGRRRTAACTCLCSLEKKISLHLGEKKTKDEKSRLFPSSDSFLNLCEQIAEVNRNTQLLSSQRDLRPLCPTKPLFFFFFLIIVRNDSVWGVAPRNDTHMNWQEADSVI